MSYWRWLAVLSRYCLLAGCSDGCIFSSGQEALPQSSQNTRSVVGEDIEGRREDEPFYLVGCGVQNVLFVLASHCYLIFFTIGESTIFF